MAENRELALVLKLVADQFQSELKKSQGALGSFNAFITDWRTQLTAAGTALFAIAKSTANFGEEALRTSQRLGATVEQTTALQYAAHLADVPVQTLEASLKKLSQNAVEAATGTGEGAKLFTSLGISATDASGRIKPLDQLLFEFQDRLGGVTNQAEFVDAGVKAFGRSFLDIVPFIRQGSAATREAMEEGKQLGVVLSGPQAQAANRFNDELKRLTAASQGLTLQVGNALIPTITELIRLFREIGVGTGISFGLKAIQAQVILLTNLFKELQATSQFLFGTGKDSLSFSGLKDRYAAIEAEGKQRLFELRNPGVLNGATGGTSGPASGGFSLVDGDSKKTGAEQERIGKAKLEIFLMQNRALEIQQRLQDEADNVPRQERLGRLIVQQTQDMVAGLEQEQLGRQIIQQTQAQLAIDDARRTKEMAEQEQLGRQIIQQTQAELAIEEARRQANRNFFDEWTDGMRRYVRDIKTGMGFGADMARRTAQTMEQGFRTFFFDIMDGKIQSFKDALSGLLQFVKQIMAQVASQLVTSAIIRAGLSHFGGALGAAGGGEIVRRYAMGGPVFGSGISDTVPALLTPGEYVLSRRDVNDIKNGLGGGGVTVVINNQSKSQVDQPTVGQGPDGKRMIYLTVRDAVRGAVDNGDLDAQLSRRFGVMPSPGRR